MTRLNQFFDHARVFQVIDLDDDVGVEPLPRESNLTIDELRQTAAGVVGGNDQMLEVDLAGPVGPVGPVGLAGPADLVGLAAPAAAVEAPRACVLVPLPRAAGFPAANAADTRAAPAGGAARPVFPDAWRALPVS